MTAQEQHEEDRATAGALQDLFSLDQIGELLARAGRWNGKDVADLLPTAIAYAELAGQFCLDAAPSATAWHEGKPRDPAHPNGHYTHGGWYDLLGAENPLLAAAWLPFRQMALRNGHPKWKAGKLAEGWWWIAVDGKARALVVNDGTVVRDLINFHHAALERLAKQDGQSVTVVGTILSVAGMSKERRTMEFTLDSGGYIKDYKTEKYPSRVIVHSSTPSIGAELNQGVTIKVSGHYKLGKAANGRSELVIIADRVTQPAKALSQN